MSRSVCRCELLLLIVLCGTATAFAQSDEPVAPESAARSADAERRELSERILQHTKEARDKLAEKLTSAPTQELQQGVVSDLEKLIELLRTSPPPSGSGSSSSPSENEQSSSDQNKENSSSEKPKPSRRSKSTGTGAGENRDQPQDSEERHGENKEAKALADRKRRLENDIWGHLPPALREQLLNTYGERMLPQYEDYVKKFYEALSEPTRKPGF